MNARSRWSGQATGDQGMFVRRSVFERLGGFADQPLMEDLELSRRLRPISRPACLRARVTTSGRRWETRGVWPTIFLMWRLRWRYWRGESPRVVGRGLSMNEAASCDLIVFAKAPVARSEQDAADSGLGSCRVGGAGGTPARAGCRGGHVGRICRRRIVCCPRRIPSDVRPSAGSAQRPGTRASRGTATWASACTGRWRAGWPLATLCC